MVPAFLRPLLHRLRARFLQPLTQELAGLHVENENLRARGLQPLAQKLAGLRTENEDLRARLNNLEALLTEHPQLATYGLQKGALPSPVVSIIMPTWNRGFVIGEAIQSVQAQSFRDWELLIVDDGSADNTTEVIQPFLADSRIRYLRQAHRGQCAARNHALRLAKGELIAYLDSDNLWYPSFLSAMVNDFASHPGLDCAYGAMVTDYHIPGRRILFEPFDREKLTHGNYIGMSTFVHRRALVARYGNFDETLQTLEDWDLILRYTEHKPARPIPVLAVRYRRLDQCVTLARPQEAPFEKIARKWRAA